MTFIIAQSIGVVGIILFVMCFHFKNMKGVLRIKFLMDIVWAAHYYLLGAVAGGISNTICSVREIIYMNKERSRMCQSKIWPLVFMGFNIFFGVLAWKGVYSILPATASVLATFAFWQKNVQTARWIALLNNILMFTYDVFVLSYMGLVAEALSFISVISALVKNKKS